MKTPEQLKGAIRNVAKKNSLMPQEVLQMFLFERILERLSVSRYKKNIILKGGLLISSMIGITERTTMDMDTTVKDIPMEEDTIRDIVKEIIAIDVGDKIEFLFVKTDRNGIKNSVPVCFFALKLLKVLNLLTDYVFMKIYNDG